MSKVATNEKLIGYDTNGKKLITAHFICDSQSDLPIQTEYDDYILYLGCTAHCITEHTDHELKSGGVWVQTLQISADYDLLLNRPQINGHILTGNQTGANLGMQNLLTFDSTPAQDSANPVTSGGIWTDQQRQDMRQNEDRASLIELVDSGAKNVLYYTKVGTSAESGSRFLNNGVRYTLQSDSSILVNRESSSANEAFCNLRLDSSAQIIDDFCNGKYVLSGTYGGCRMLATNNTYNAIDSDGNGVVLQDRGSQTGINVQIRVAASASPNNVTIKPMICTKAAWDVSHAYQPYRPSYQELYEMVLALQSGTAQ